MPLTEPSSLETALSRIVGEPAVTSAGTAPPADQGTFNLAPRSSLISYSPGIAQTGTSVNLSAAQPVSVVPAMPVSQASALTSPAVAAPVAAASQPITPSTPEQLRSLTAYNTAKIGGYGTNPNYDAERQAKVQADWDAMSPQAQKITLANPQLGGMTPMQYSDQWMNVVKAGEEYSKSMQL